MAKAPASQPQTQQVDLIPVPQAARLLDISEQELTLLSRKGVLPPIDAGRMPLVRLIQRYIAHIRADVATTTDVAADLGVTNQWIRTLINEGFIARTGNGVRRKDAFVGYIRWLKDEQRKSSKVALEGGLKASRQAEIDMRIAERRRELIETKEADLVITAVVGAINTEMNGFAARVTRDVAVRREIEKKLNEAFDRIDKALARGRRALATGEAVTPADAED